MREEGIKLRLFCTFASAHNNITAFISSFSRCCSALPTAFSAVFPFLSLTPAGCSLALVHFTLTPYVACVSLDKHLCSL